MDQPTDLIATVTRKSVLFHGVNSLLAFVIDKRTLLVSRTVSEVPSSSIVKALLQGAESHSELSLRFLLTSKKLGRFLANTG